MIRPVSLGVPLRRGTKMRNLLRLLLIAGFASYSLSDPFLIEVTEDDGDDGDDGYGGYRLPGIHIPSSYIINLQVSADVFSGDSTAFNGTVVIDFQVTDETDNIQIHAPVDVDAVSLQGDGQAINISDYSSYNSTTAILTITAEEVLTTAVNYTLTIEYTGILRSSNMNGFYRSEYYESDGTKHYLVTSKFEPTWARYAFPSFDEPQLKARFTLVLIYPRNLSLSALGNTPQQSVEDVDDEYEKVTFGESPVMSTYLVAFIVSRFTCSAGTNLTDEVPYQVCSRPETEGDRAWAVEVGPPLMKALEDFTNTTYSSQLLGKMDQIAVPDFASGAMENWGLVSYRETYLLWNNEDSSTRYKRGIATVISHEFTHSWFGNLVTLEWWDYLFLNEGFARYYQYFATAKAEQLSDWELDKQFIVDQVQTVLVTDGSSSSAALTSKASSPTQISNKFSTISYSKGASIFRMMEHFLGTDNYHNGIRAYLTNHAWGNTNPSDLWSSIAEFALAELLPTNVTLAEVMENWVDQGGYPVITVTASDNDVILSQERFVYSGTSDTEWYVPISYTLSSDENKFEDTSARVWLIPGETATFSGVLEDNDWIIVNNQESGYYRVNYDTVLWQRIEEVLLSDHTVIDVLNRAQIVDDLLNLARAGILTYSKAIEVGRYLVNETEYYPWYSAITAYNYLLRRVGEESTLGVEISALMLRLMQAVYESVSFTDLDADQHIYTLKLVLILTSACKLGHEDCVSNAKSLFEQYKNGTSIDRDLRTIVYCNGLRYSDDSTIDWEFLWEKLQSISLATEELTLIAGLGCTKNTTLLKYYLEQSLNTSSRIRLQDFASVWSAVYTSSTEGVDAAFEYFTENYESIYNYYSSSASLLSTIVGRFTTEEQLAKLEEFIASDGLSSSVKSTAESALASAKVNLAWVANIEEDLLGYFEVGEDSPSSTTEETGSSVKSAASLSLILSVVFFDRLLL